MVALASKKSPDLPTGKILLVFKASVWAQRGRRPQQSTKSAHYPDLPLGRPGASGSGGGLPGVSRIPDHLLHCYIVSPAFVLPDLLLILEEES
jgi:hypothetical protein